MIHIQAVCGADGLEISAVGHAAFAAHGSDIVCAGVSALLFGFVAYLERCLSISAADGEPAGDQTRQLERTVEEGCLWVRTRGMQGLDRQAWAVTAAGLAAIACRYPAHVRLEEMAAPAAIRHERER